jgi:hypothetical protein
MIPVRGEESRLGATVNATVPEPKALPAGDVTVIHDAAVEADQGQPVPVVRVKLPEPPPAVTGAAVDVGDRE